ncbi:MULTISPECIES: hypothetical protein [Heliobacterium]|uniref:Uncharacterized protein n=1 Tax=Heliobacterium chlorum TaxID=2698 RepID=A0ABR7SWU9_HELCL|nr:MULTISPECIES: hypothetical protein [Heliobacterium]MBC9782941.1 hypothetical protein [Heliobacterium chlorum]
MNGTEVRSYVLSPEELKELWDRLGKPGEVAPGVKAPKKRSKAFVPHADNTEE